MPAVSAGSFGPPLINAHCREFEVNKWALSEFIVRRLLPVVGIHPFPLDELLLMSAAVCRMRPRHIFEWGTHVGKSARIFYETSRWLGLDTTIHSIDLPDHVPHAEHPGVQRGMMVRGLASVRLYQGDGLETAPFGLDDGVDDIGRGFGGRDGQGRVARPAQRLDLPDEDSGRGVVPEGAGRLGGVRGQGQGRQGRSVDDEAVP